jgi:TolB protein
MGQGARSAMSLRVSGIVALGAVLWAIAGCSFLGGGQSPALTYLEPALSPDGRWLAYESALDGKLELYAKNLETGTVRRLTENQVDDFSPSWSPDGVSIVFASNPGGNVDIYVMDVATRETRRLTTDAGSDMYPTWASDGRIYFNSDRTKAWEVYTILQDGTGLTAITALAP